MTRVDVGDLLHFQVVQGHEQFGAKRAVVRVLGPEEQGPQKLEDHVVEAHVPPEEQGPQKLEDHVVEAHVPSEHRGQLLYDFSLPTHLTNTITQR